MIQNDTRKLNSDSSSGSDSDSDNDQEPAVKRPDFMKAKIPLDYNEEEKVDLEVFQKNIEGSDAWEKDGVLAGLTKNKEKEDA